MNTTNSLTGQTKEMSSFATLRELIDFQASGRPDMTFLLSPETGEVVTFSRLRRRCASLAAQFSSLGLMPGDKVAILSDNSVFAIHLFLGAMYGGYAAVPLNLRAGVAQLAFTLDHSDAKVVFAGQEQKDLLPQIMDRVGRPVQVMAFGDVGSVKEEDGCPLAVIASETTALLMYTSGSTGQPRAAVHTHGSLLAHARNAALAHRLTACDRSLLVLPLYHINAECVTLLPTLLTGGSVVVPAHFQVSQFWDWMDVHYCTWTAVVPTIISQLMDWKDPFDGKRQESFSRIRFIRSSSAPLSPALHRQFAAKYPLPLLQAMGCTEGGNVFSNPAPPEVNKIGSPGLPWGFEVRIVNRDGVDLSAGDAGEVLLRGPGMMKEYYKDPVATAASIDGEGWLHTGDLAFRDADGYFFVVGRSKELIIKAGTNIAPKQIDEALESHPAVFEAAAVGVPDRYVGEDVVAFVVLRAAAACSEMELLSFCEGILGHFKTPSRIHFAQSLPKGPSGKVQRLRLLQDAARPEVARGSSLPGDGASLPLEEIIAASWSELLKLPKVSPQDNFFALGGHSLMAIQCLSQLRDKIPVMLSLTDFFENATPGDLAAVLRARLSAPARMGGVDPQLIPPRDRTKPCPLSLSQRRIWFFEQLAPGVPLYNESEAVRLRGDLKMEALEKAINAVIARHEILRSTVSVEDNQPFFLVKESWLLSIKVMDLSCLSPEQREAEVARLLVSEPALPYALSAAPGIRATLARLGERDHVLIVMMHHLVCDWASMGVLWREMAAFYRSFCLGQTLEMAPLPIQYGDYAAWMIERNKQGFAEDLAYWEETLRAAPDLLELPADRPRPPVVSYRGARMRVRFDKDLTQALRECSRQAKVSLFTVYSAGLDALFYRYTGQQDILLGIPLADREGTQLQPLIGFLLHTHVLRSRVEGNMAFRDLFAPVQKSLLDLYSHSAAPWDQIVSRLKPGRSLSHSPVFQVMVNWRDRDQLLSFIGMDGLEVESLLAESRTSKFDLTLILTDTDEGVDLEIEYNRDLFDEDRIARLAGHYRNILRAAAADSSAKVDELPLLTDKERKKILFDWNRASVPYPRDRCLHELVEEQAQRSPGARAVCLAGGPSLTYRELDTRANQLAWRLQDLGVGPDCLVGVCLDRSLEMVIGLLAVLKAGGAYVPLDPEYPPDRLAFMLDDSAVKVLLTQEKLLEAMPGYPCPTLVLDRDWEAIARESSDKPPCAASPSHLAYSIYTSGSTGKPKGVELTHGGVVNFINSMWQAPGMTAQDVVLAITTICFDIAGLELWLPLTVGARVVVASRAILKDGWKLAALLDQQQVTVMQATPSTWSLLLATGWQGNPAVKILCGGEAWPAGLAAALLPKCASLWNMYGPTETTIWSAALRIVDPKEVLIGGIVANTQFYVVDGRKNPVPVGIAGELLIGGDGLARGYHNRPELTREKFQPSPFGPDGARVYRTGDRVCWHEDGRLEFLGRADYQVKLRGFRIELQEIEAVLNQYPGIQSSVVIVREDNPGDKRLAGYLLTQGNSLDVPELRHWLKSKLPDYMVPAAFVTLDAFPMTSNGKVDRKALPNPAASRTVSAELQEPRNSMEELLASIWRRELKLEDVSVTDNFFDLGGHSLLLGSIQAKLQRQLGRNVSIVELFQFPTIRALAAHLDGPPAPGSGRLSAVQARAQRQGSALEAFAQTPRTEPTKPLQNEL